MHFYWVLLMVVSVSTGSVFADPLSKQEVREPPLTKEEVDQKIKTIAKIVKDDQYKEDQEFIFGVQWHHEKGGFPTTFGINAFGTRFGNLIRNIGFPSEGHYFTCIPMQYLLEIASLVEYPEDIVTDEMLIMAIESGENQKDHNYPGKNILGLWTQRYNETADLWYMHSENIANLLPYVKRGGDFLRWFKDTTGIQYSDNIDGALDLLEFMSTFVRWGPEFDDTTIYFSYGGLLKNTRYQKAYEFWNKMNEQPEAAIGMVNKYAYRPFSDDINENLIIPNSFYLMRHLLWEVEQQGRKNFSVITEFIYNYDNTQGDNVYNTRLLLFANQVDFPGQADVLHAITVNVLADIRDPKSWFTDEVQGLYRDTVETQAFLMKHNFSDHIDFAFIGCENIIQGMWFVSRYMQVLTSADELPYPVMVESRDLIADAMRSNGTDYLLDQSGTDWDGLIYFDGFLGNADLDLNGDPLERHQDRLFITATAVNALYNTWTVKGKFIDNTPERVKAAVKLGAEWVYKNALTDVYQPYNAVAGFSGEVYQSYNWAFPSNQYNWINGTKIPDGFVLKNQKEMDQLQAYVRGVIPEDEYNKMLKEPFLGVPLHLDYQGQNSKKDGYFPIWNCPTFTHCASMLALANYRKLFLM